MTKPTEMNELQMERVLYLWHTFKKEKLAQEDYDKFIVWLEENWFMHSKRAK